MHFTALSQAMPALLDSGVSIELISAPGRGKSEFVRDLVAKMSARDGKPWGFSTCFLATMTPSDLMGYMVPRVDDQGRDVSRFTMPPWMQTVDGKLVTDYERGFLFLDEYGQGEPDTKRASAELLLNGQLGPWKLPKGWTVIAASNRSSDRSGVTKSFDFVVNRRLQIEITDDLQSWEDWAFEHGIDPTFITFANQNPHIVFSDGVPEKQGPWCTPRSLVMLNRIFNQMREPNGALPVSGVANEVAAGMIGEAAAAQLFAFIRLGRDMPRFADIVARPAETKLPDAPDARMLVCYSLAARATEDTIASLVTYIERFPKEFTVTFVKAAVRRDPSLINSQAFGDWAVRNASLMSMIINRK